ncbi:extracellular solute-binding protein family 5 [Thermaerobacter marianensis DSM 12885]|uniref:Extracellular solute-binding protein family 5 n=1 Tax=Thermaerobacter marianensis (strain ATCC 700841 / DSM 12885 / JCM 10246 / 7p75a) TaxID=644966 RepID=E6SGC4_THEM7|nr:ABC transporter substrate-binding protein [Thermaerobacter marianensis]ADU51576.1 extracellular solute-binding protein family 5 [Thermaerobacter marianensis DSM 12885]
MTWFSGSSWAHPNPAPASRGRARVHRTGRGRRWLALFALVTLVLAGCGSGATGGGGGESTGGSSGGTGAAGPVTITIGINADPPNLDPAMSSALVDRYVQNSIFDKLYELDENLQVVPELAEALPEVSEDGKVYTIRLRQGITFHDGTPVNADAVVFNLERYLNPDSARYSELSAVDRVEKVDEYTVRIVLKQPYSPLLYTLTDRAGMIASPKAIQEAGDQFGQHPVGSGPFKFESRIKGDQIVLVKNPNYWREGLPKADKIVWKVVTDDNVKVVNLKAGQLDIIDTVPAQSIADLQSNANLKVDIGPGLGFQGIYLNTEKEPFNDPYLRRAVDLAIDRATLVRVVFQDTADPGYGPFPPGSPAAEASGEPPQRNLDEVKNLLAQGGQPDGFRFTLKTGTGPVTQQIAQVIKDMLADAGIEMEIQQVEFGSLLDDTDSGNFQAAALGWSGRPDPDGNIYPWFYTGGSQNDSRYSNPQVDRLLDQARQVLDMNQRLELYRQVMEQVHRDAPYIYLYYPKNVKAYSAKVQGFVNYPDGIIRTENLTKAP